MAKLPADNAYLDLASKAQEWVTGPAEDIFRSVVHGGPGDEPPAVGAVASVTQAVAATGKLPEAVAWAVGHGPTCVERHRHGRLAARQRVRRLRWHGIHLDRCRHGDGGRLRRDAVQADADYIEKIGASTGLFVDGSAHQSLLQRLA